MRDFHSFQANEFVLHLSKFDHCDVFMTTARQWNRVIRRATVKGWTGLGVCQSSRQIIYRSVAAHRAIKVMAMPLASKIFL